MSATALPDSIWSPVAGTAWSELFADVNAQLRYPLPDDTMIQETRLSCYPRHRLLRFLIPMPGRLRESHAFHSPGELHPIDLSMPFARFVEDALEIRTPEQLIEAVRIHVVLSASVGGWATPLAERRFPVETWDDLELDADATIDDDTRKRAETLLGPPVLLPPEPDDPPDAPRVRIAVAGGGRLAAWTCRVSARGVERLDVQATPHVLLPLRPQPVSSDRYVVLEREVAYTPERFLRHIAAGRPLSHARVTGSVHARGRTFDEPVSVSAVTFEGDIDLAGAVFANGLELHACSIGGRLLLRDARVEGSLEAARLRFTGTSAFETVVGEWERTDLDGTGLVVTGSLLLEGLAAKGCVALAHADVRGDLRLGGAEFGAAGGSLSGWLPFPVLVLSGARVGGDCRLGPGVDVWRTPDTMDEAIEAVAPGHHFASSVIHGGVLARRLDVGGELMLAGLRCEGSLDLAFSTIGGSINALDESSGDPRLVVYGRMDLSNTRVGASMLLSGMFIRDDLNLMNCRVDGSLFVRTSQHGNRRIRPAIVRGEVTLSGLRAGDVEFEGSQLGAVSFITGELGRLFLRAGIEDFQDGERTVSRVIPCRTGTIWFGDCTILNGIGTEGLHVGTAAEGGTDAAPSFRMRNVRCGGDVVLSYGDFPPPFSDEPDREFWASGPPSPADHATRVGGDLDIRALRVEGRLALSNFAAGGHVRIRNCIIEQGLHSGAALGSTPARDDRVETRCRSLDLELTRVGADADLSGIVVTGDGAASAVRAHGLQVAGRLLFSAPRGPWLEVDGISQKPEMRFDAVIDGSLDLSVAEASHLVVSGSSFTAQDASIGINLERGTFRRLHVLEPWPFRHDLSDVKVERWQIPTEHLLTFLNRSKPFRRSTYIEIERVLRNEAQDAEADRVYRGMRRRAIDEAREAGESGRRGDRVGHFARTTGSRILGWAYGWGTLYWLPILVVALPTFLLSWGLFSIPANVEATPIALVSRGVQATSGVRPAELGFTWGAADGLWLALRYHIPVVPLAARGIWEPTNDHARLPWPADSPVLLPFSGEGYAYVIYLLHWIVWPLFLYGLGRKVIRDRA
jgi:hypothetical protein